MLDTSKIPYSRLNIDKNEYKTNCITKIPQDIKLELNIDNIIILKANSKIYIPNGFEEDGITRKFDVKIIEEDISSTYPYSVDAFLFVLPNNTIYPLYINQCYSGDIAPTIPETAGDGVIWYDTANNIIKSSTDKGITWNIEKDISLPICSATGNDQSSNMNWKSINQIFNGFGYIGLTFFALPGVEGIIPNGRTENGNLNNLHFNIDKILIYTLPINLIKFDFAIVGDNLNNIRLDYMGYGENAWKFDQDQNKMFYGKEFKTWMDFGTFTTDATRIIFAQFKNVFQNNDNNVYINRMYNIPDYTKGIELAYNTFEGNGWRAPSAGIIVGGVNWAGFGKYIYVNGSIAQSGNNETTAIFIIVDENDLVTSNGAIESSVTKIMFYPFKTFNY